MTVEEVYEHYGSAWLVNKALGMSHGSFYAWKKRGFIPLIQQFRLEKLTSGALVANEAHVYKTEKTHEIHLPAFRYFDKKHGLCRVESLVCNADMRTKITYVIPEKRERKVATFNREFLMQAADIKDSKQQTVFEGDIVQIAKGKYYTFAHVSNVEVLKDLGEFTIVGHIYDGVEYGHQGNKRRGKTRDV